MTDQPPEQHEHVTRMLRDQGAAQAPPGLTDDVMRRVRAEPRRRERPALRFVAVLAAAALLTSAGIAGISRLGSGASSSSAGSAAQSLEKTPSAAVPHASGPAGGVPEDRTFSVRHAPTAQLRAFGQLPACSSSTYTVHVPPGEYRDVTRTLQRAARSNGAQAATNAKVIVRRDSAARRIRITCP